MELGGCYGVLLVVARVVDILIGAVPMVRLDGCYNVLDGCHGVLDNC